MLSTGMMREPIDPVVRPSRQTPSLGVSLSPSALLTKSLFFVYQQGVGPAKGTRCAMSPSCSEYGKIAIKRYGVVKGTILAFDRLHRCGHDLLFYDSQLTEHGVSHEDPPPVR